MERGLLFTGFGVPYFGRSLRIQLDVCQLGFFSVGKADSPAREHETRNMRWAAIACSPLVHLGDTRLARAYTRAVLAKRVRVSMSSLAAEPAKSTVDVECFRRDMLWGGGAKPVAHFNSAGDSPMPSTVLDRVTQHMQVEATLGGYEAAANVQEELDAVYDSAAQLINAKPDEIALQVCIVYIIYEYVQHLFSLPSLFLCFCNVYSVSQ